MVRHPLRLYPIGLFLVGGVFALATPTRAQEDECPRCGDAAELIERLGLREGRTAMRDVPGWSPPSKIVTRLPAAMSGALAQAAPDVEFVNGRSLQEVLPELADADGFIGGCNARIAAAAESLVWYQSTSAGVERCTGTPLEERGVVVTNAQRLYGPQIAEHVMAMTLAFARSLHRHAAAQREREWRGAEDESWELAGRTMLVVGLGGIGTEVAWRADALGMRVTATRNSSRSGPDFVDYVGLAHELLDLAAQADVIVNATPLTPETTDLFDARFFDVMKESAYFINVGRGGSVVTEDLVAALEAGELAGAGLDVTDPEPLPAGHPLWTMPNVIVTPHSAASSDGGRRRLELLAFENIRRFVAGDPLLSVVDLSRGY